MGAVVVVFGVSQWAELAHFYLTHDSPHEVVAFTLDRDYIESESYKDSPVVFLGVTSIQGFVANLEARRINTKGDPEREIFVDRKSCLFGLER